MKILFFIESLRAGGKERRLLELIKGLLIQHPKIKMELVIMEKEIYFNEIFSTRIKIHYIIRKNFKKDPRVFYQFFKIAKNSKANIINVWGNMPAIYAILAKVLLRIPLINNQITDARTFIPKGILSYKFTFLFSDLIIANSYAGLKSYDAPKEKSMVIYNGFNFDRIKKLKSPIEIRRKLNINTEFVVGMVATFSPLKDYETFICAANRILKTTDNITFLCVGGGDDTKYRKMIDPDISDKILILGKQNDVESLMNMFDIGVLTTYTEGISNSVMELMSLGKPVIVSGGGGTKELVVQNETGFIIGLKSVDELVTKIEYLLDNKDHACEMGEKAKNRIITNFSIDTMITKFAKEYRKLSS